MSAYAFAKVEQVTNLKIAMPSNSVSLSKTGRIGLSREFVDGNHVTSGGRASLYWDGSRKAIAFAFTPGERKPTAGSFSKVQAVDGYSVAPIGDGSAAYINAGGFFKKIGIDPSEHQGYYKYEALDADEVGISDSSKTVFVVTLG